MTHPPSAELIPRPSGRAILTDSQGRVFLLRGIDPYNRQHGGFLWTPGGGMDEGESPDQAVVREPWEEIGLADAEAGPVVLIRTSVFPMKGIWYSSVETFFWVQAPDGFHAAPQGLTQIEQDVIQDMGWHSADEIRAITEHVYPACLADLIDHIIQHGPPAEPWIEAHDRANE